MESRWPVCCRGWCLLRGSGSPLGPVRAGEGENGSHSFKKECQAFQEPGRASSQLLVRRRVARPVRMQREARPDGGNFPSLGRTCLCVTSRFIHLSILLSHLMHISQGLCSQSWARRCGGQT